MFSKENEKLESFVGPNTDFKGELNVKGILRIDGRVDGRLSAESVVLSETAVVKGDVTAQKITVGGKIDGNLRAGEIVEIKTKGKVLGDISTNRFSVMEGGEFNGKIEMRIEEKRVLDFEAKN
jgi:cytoskeletal protein CcmA (bactofilin family)